MALSTSRTVITQSGLTTTQTFNVGGIQAGVSNLHTIGYDVVSNTGTGVTVRSTGNAVFSGVITATKFVGDISEATGAAAGLGTALSQTQTDPLNKVYYTNKVLSISTTTTIDHPATANLAYTQYGDIKIEDGHDLIIKDGDDFKYDILGISTTKIPSNQFPSGLSGDLTGNVTGNLTGNVTGNADTATTLKSNSSVSTSGIITASSFVGDVTGNVTGSGSNLTNIPAGQLTGALPAISGANLTGIPIIPPVFRAIRSDYQVLANNTDTVINFDNDSSASSFDTNNFYNTSDYKFTPTIAGYYQLTAQLEFSLNTGNNLFGLMIFKNGSEYLRIRRWNDGSNSNVNINITGIVPFNGSSDYAQVYGWQNSGGNITVFQGSGRTFFEGHYIRPL